MTEQKPTIEVLRVYGGRLTQGRHIQPGVYAVDDPALYGAAADYLVKNGHARRVTMVVQKEPQSQPEAVPKEPQSDADVLQVSNTPDDEVPPADTDDDYEIGGIDDHTKDWIMDKLDAEGIPFNSKSNKPELYALLVEYKGKL